MRAHAFFGHVLRSVPGGLHAVAAVAAVLLSEVSVNGKTTRGGRSAPGTPIAASCTTECIGLHAAKRGTRFEALEPIRQGVRERFGEIGDGVARGLRLRHDHGSNYLADDFQQEVAFFGIESSPSFVREPEGNGVAERFIRTLKENLLWVRSFDTIEELRLALLAFKRTYNEHLGERPSEESQNGVGCYWDGCLERQKSPICGGLGRGER